MKKIILIALLALSFTSCSLLNKDEEDTSSGTTLNELDGSGSVSLSGAVDEEGKYTFENTGSVQVEKGSEIENTSVEKNIETIVETNEETSKENVTEEEILNDIDSLINDIINSAENG